MVKIVTATYTNGELILNEKLSPDMEGKTFQIMILETIESAETIDSSNSNIKQFLERVKKYSVQLPHDYKFNRDEIYER